MVILISLDFFFKKKVLLKTGLFIVYLKIYTARILSFSLPKKKKLKKKLWKNTVCISSKKRAFIKGSVDILSHTKPFLTLHAKKEKSFCMSIIYHYYLFKLSQR